MARKLTLSPSQKSLALANAARAIARNPASIGPTPGQVRTRRRIEQRRWMRSHGDQVGGIIACAGGMILGLVLVGGFYLLA